MDFELASWSKRAGDLIDRSRRFFDTASPPLRTFAAKLPPSEGQTGRPRIAFIGQYSAGKSTLIRALTGRSDIITGGGISTQVPQTIEWNGLELIDTPGIETRLRPDHDELSLTAMASADLVVTVVTTGLFDEHFAEVFRGLAVDRGLGVRMMLVVNKMLSEGSGNTPARQDLLREDLRLPLSPLSPEGLRVSFVDARRAVEARESAQDSDADADWRKSNVDSFIQELNTFVRERHLVGRVAQPLFHLEQALTEAVAKLENRDPTTDQVEGLLLRKRQLLVDARDRAQATTRSLGAREAERIRAEGRRVAESIDGTGDAASLTASLEAVENALTTRVTSLEAELSAALRLIVEDLDATLERVSEEPLFSGLGRSLDGLFAGLAQNTSPLGPETARRAQTAADGAGRLGHFLVENGYRSGGNGLKSLTALKNYSGTGVHSAVKSGAKFFNFKLKPWQAVKATKGLVNAGRALGVAGALLGVFLQVKADVDSEKRRVALANARAEVRDRMCMVGEGLEQQLLTAATVFTTRYLDPEVDAIDEGLRALRGKVEDQSREGHELMLLLDEARALARELKDVSHVHVDA